MWILPLAAKTQGEGGGREKKSNRSSVLNNQFPPFSQCYCLINYLLYIDLASEPALSKQVLFHEIPP